MERIPRKQRLELKRPVRQRFAAKGLNNSAAFLDPPRHFYAPRILHHLTLRPMSEPRLPETRSSSRDIASVGHAALQHLAVTVLTQHSGSAAGAEALATAARRAFDDLVQVCTPLIGQVGVDALTARAVHLAQREYPWLVEAAESADAKEPFARVIVNLRRQHPAIATEGTAAVFATFAGLLVTFIGEPLTTALLRKAWPNAFSDARTEET